MKNSLQEQKGFTLIEVIVTIIIAALMGVAIFTYMGNVLTRSHEPIVMVRALAEAMESMEEVVVEYNEYIRGGRDPGVWTDFKAQGAEVTGAVDWPNDGGLEIIEVTITVDNQTIRAIFTQ